MKTTKPPSDPKRFVANIKAARLTIYDPIQIGDPNLWIPAPELQDLLAEGLQGLNLQGLALRSRSKVVKQQICRILGYAVPTTFRKTKPRFPGQLFDTYIQKANNLQIWNEELAPTRRYVIIRVSQNDLITKVRVVTGDALAYLDTTGTLTQKYQARCIAGKEVAELVTPADTELLRTFVTDHVPSGALTTPILHPRAGELLSIKTIFGRLRGLIGTRFANTGYDQERSRGAALHNLVVRALGYASYQDDGQFPDVRHQLLEVKLQTSPTVDLGLVQPNSTAALDVPQIRGRQIRHCDVRYAVLCGRIVGSDVQITHLHVTTGEAFFSRFPQFGGKVLNKKIQIPLPGDFFNT